MDEERKHYCDMCGRLTDHEVLRVLGFCSACEQRLQEEADAEHADADEVATDLEERRQLALDRADEDLLDSMTGMTEDERRMIG